MAINVNITSGKAPKKFKGNSRSMALYGPGLPNVENAGTELEEKLANGERGQISDLDAANMTGLTNSQKRALYREAGFASEAKRIK